MRKYHMYVLMSQIGVLIAMVGMYLSFNNKSETIVKHEYVPAKVPISYLYYSVKIKCAGSGVGVAVSNKYAMTCYHVVSDVGKDGTAWVEWKDEDGQHSSVVSVVALDAARDLAIIKILDESKSFKHYATLSENKMLWGAPIVAIGSPGYKPLAPFDGRFVEHGEGPGMDIIQALCVPGHSGGAIFDTMTGEVIGLNSRLFGFMEVSGNPVLIIHEYLIVPSKWMLDFIRENGIKL